MNATSALYDEVQELRQEVEQWKVYADALEAALRKVADLSDDQLKRMQAAEGLRTVRPAALGE